VPASLDFEWKVTARQTAQSKRGSQVKISWKPGEARVFGFLLGVGQER